MLSGFMINEKLIKKIQNTRHVCPWKVRGWFGFIGSNRSYNKCAPGTRSLSGEMQNVKNELKKPNRFHIAYVIVLSFFYKHYKKIIKLRLRRIKIEFLWLKIEVGTTVFKSCNTEIDHRSTAYFHFFYLLLFLF